MQIWDFLNSIVSPKSKFWYTENFVLVPRTRLQGYKTLPQNCKRRSNFKKIVGKLLLKFEISKFDTLG